MKKMMMIAALIGMAAFSQAASLNWGSGTTVMRNATDSGNLVNCLVPRTLDVATGVETLNTVLIRASRATSVRMAPRRRPILVVELLFVSVLSLIFMIVRGSTTTV